MDTQAPSHTAPDTLEPTEDFATLLREDDRSRATSVDRSNGGKQIDATVIAVTADAVYLDIGYKTEGVLALSVFGSAEKAPEPGDRVRVAVRGRNLDGYYELTRQRGAASPRDFASLEEAFEAGGSVPGTVTGLVKGGLTVDIGMRAFLPLSRSGARDTAEAEALVGQPIRVRITELNLEGGERSRQPDAVVDRRAVLEEEARAAADSRYAELAEGMTVTGTVRSLTPFGAFVDLGGADALLHISDMAWHRVTDPADVVSAGDSIDVQVLRIDTTDPARRRIAVGLKQTQPNPWDTAGERFHLGDKVRGTVTRNADFGTFLELEPGVEGLVHISEMSWGKKVHKPSDVLKVGDQAEVVILGIDLAARRISLGLKQALGDPWGELAKTLHPGSEVQGKVSSFTKFGAFVTLAEGVEGMVHISEITAERRLNHPSDALHLGETVKAVVLELDREKRQMRLSLKQLVPSGLEEFLAEHKPGDRVTGRVLDLDASAGTARVELGEGVLATCSLPPAAPEPETPRSNTGSGVDLSQLSLLGSKWKTSSAPAKKGGQKSGQEPTLAAQPGSFSPGQVRDFRIRTLDAATKKLELEPA